MRFAFRAQLESRANRHRLLTLGMALFAIVPALFAEDPATEGTTEKGREPFTSVEQVVKYAKPSVVVITMTGRDGTEQGLGTGFVISDDGLIATNLHVIGEARAISVQTHEGRRLEVAEVYASDRQLDLAIVRVKGEGLQPLELADATVAPQGEQIVVLGNPRGLRHSVVAGVLSGTREIDSRNMLQIAMPIEPGNSGGPVLDMRGRVLGVVTMKSAVTDNLGFAVPSNHLQPMLEKPNRVPIDRWLKIGSLDPKRWKPLFGARWQKRGGRIAVSGSGEGFGGRSLLLWHEKPPKPPYEVAAWVKLGDEAGAAGLVFCSDGDDKHYGFYPSNGKLRLTRFDGPDVFSWNVLGEVDCPQYEAGQWNHLKVRVEEDRVRCYVNDEPVFEARDRRFETGSVGLAKFRDTEAEFRRFELGEKLAPSKTPAEVLEQTKGAIERLPGIAEITPAALAELAQGSHASHASEVLERQARELRQRANELERIAASVRSQAALAELAALVKGESPDLDLLRACLIVARLDGEEIDVDEYVARVDHMAGEIQAVLNSETSESDKVNALNKYLFEENGFHGSRTDYYHRANSYLNRVIDDREGLPITLSILYIELGKRLGLDFKGLGLPGHFVVLHRPAEGELRILDPFDGGVELSREEASRKVEETSGRKLEEGDLEPPSDRAIVLRVLSNLLNVAQQKADREAMLRYLDASLTLDPQLLRERGMRAMIRHETGRKAAAVSDLDWFLEQKPEGAQLDKIRELREVFLNGQAR